MDVLSERLKRLERNVRDVPTIHPANLDYYDARVDTVRNLAISSASIAARLTKVILTWVSVEDPNVSHYQVWVSRISNGIDQPYLATEVKDSPAAFNLVSDAAGTALAHVRTVMKSGVASDIKIAPSIPFEVF